MLERFRSEHHITDKEHEKMVQELGWTMLEYEQGMKKILDSAEVSLTSGPGQGQGQGDDNGGLAARAMYMSDEYSSAGDDQVSGLPLPPILPPTLTPYP